VFNNLLLRNNKKAKLGICVLWGIVAEFEVHLWMFDNLLLRREASPCVLGVLGVIG
jgi:hypothetical protein